MLAALVAAAALWPQLAMPHWTHAAPQRPDHGHVGAWDWRLRTDRFSGQISCRLEARRASYAHRAVTIRMDPGVDTGEALYRIDLGVARSPRTDAMLLAQRGVALSSDDLMNPSAGRVPIPAEALAGARRVYVRERPRASITVVRVDGLVGALQAARAAGCSETSFD